jgi:hypothetical protein
VAVVELAVAVVTTVVEEDKDACLFKVLTSCVVEILDSEGRPLFNIKLTSSRTQKFSKI